MTLHVVSVADVAAQPWRNGGGLTRPLLSWPTVDGWLVRVSVAEIAHNGPFSSFPETQRFIVALTGNGIRLGPPLEVVLQPGDSPQDWSGDFAPDCSLIDGSTTDLNAMFDTRNGNGWLRAACHSQHDQTATIRGMFSLQPAMLRTGLTTIALPDSSLVWSDDDQTDWELSSDGAAWSLQYTLHAAMREVLP
jgi:uncharacterized protein